MRLPSLIALLALAAPVSLQAHEAAPPAAKAPALQDLLARDLTGSPDKEIVMFTVSYAPGGSSMPHRHDAQVFVYVLEGAVKLQVQGGPLETVKAGGVFYEKPDDIHLVSANASQTAPARFLVVMVKDKGKPASSALAH